MRNGLIIMPVLDCWAFTDQALGDCGCQLSGDVEILIVNQGSSTEVRRKLDKQAQDGFAQRPSGVAGVTVGMPTIRVVTHDPPLRSLAATWNRTLEYAWACGYEDALVVNNDIRLKPTTYQALRTATQIAHLDLATPVNVKDRYDHQAPIENVIENLAIEESKLGGPDFSCFLITPRLHQALPFDEGFVPAYHEDIDLARRVWLHNRAENDLRASSTIYRIAGLPIGYFHAGSATINRSPEAREAWDAQFQKCRARYVEKWGGLPHHEKFLTPFTDIAGERLLDDLGTPGGAIL